MQIIASFFTLGMFIVFIANVAYGFLILTIFRNYFTLININLFYSKVSGEGLVSILIIIIGLVYCLKKHDRTLYKVKCNIFHDFNFI